jgi:hypothetical protein
MKGRSKMFCQYAHICGNCKQRNIPILNDSLGNQITTTVTTRGPAGNLRNRSKGQSSAPKAQFEDKGHPNLNNFCTLSPRKNFCKLFQY